MKAEALATNHSTHLDKSNSSKINEQTIYKCHQDGNVRYGADRHALTCFIDLNFP